MKHNMKAFFLKKVMPLMLSLTLCMSLMAGCGVDAEKETPDAPAQSQSDTQTQEETSVPEEEPVEEEPVEEEPVEENPVEEESVEEPYAAVAMNVAGLKGPTGMGMAKLMEDAAAGTAANDYTFTLESAPDAIVGKLTSGELDVAAIPVNLAATLYQKTEGKVQLAAVNTLGVLYILDSASTVTSVADLKGKTIYATGQGSTPEYVLNYILEKNGLVVGEDVIVEYMAEHAQLAASFLAGECDIAMLPEPFVTQVMTKSETAAVALNLTEEWSKVAGDAQLAMGCIAVRKAFADENPAAMAKFLEEYKASVEYITNTENVEDAAALIEKHDVMAAAVAKNALPRCNIVFLAGDEMKASAGSFLQVVFEAQPGAVGGQLPNEDFYYIVQ